MRKKKGKRKSKWYWLEESTNNRMEGTNDISSVGYVVTFIVIISVIISLMISL